MKLFKGMSPVQNPPRETVHTEECGKQLSGFFGTVVSDVGLLRKNNEDNFLLGQYLNEKSEKNKALSLFVPGQPSGWNLVGIFDGMGGGEKGEVAALLAAQVFRRAAQEAARTADRQEADRILRLAFQEANNRILELREQYGMYGTTGTVLCTDGEVFKIYHLGDSRAYLLRKRDMFQLSRDHTLARMKIEAGIYREKDPRAEQDRHKLTEYIGGDPSGESLGPDESNWLTVMAGDSVLLCSDGLYDMCSDAEIGRIMIACADHRTRASALVKRALDRGGADNVTCLCLEFTKQ